MVTDPSVNIKNDKKDIDGATKWSCPKCSYVCFDEVKIQLNSVAKKSRFNFQRWLTSTIAPEDVSISPNDQHQVLNLFTKYGSAPIKSGAKKSKICDVQHHVLMSQLDHRDFKLCFRKLCDVSC